MAYVVGGEELMFCRERLFADLVTEDILKVKMQGSNTGYTFCEDGYILYSFELPDKSRTEMIEQTSDNCKDERNSAFF
jgi:hypothetical protein